jgi:hypothetical protein
MKALFQVMVCVLALSTVTLSRSQDNDADKEGREDHWEDYQPRTLQSIVDMHRQWIEDLDRNSKKKGMLLTGDNFPSCARLVYLEKSRSMPPNRQILLDAWRRSTKEDAPPPDLFLTEVLFREGTHERWIAVQKPLLAALLKEAKNGQTVTAYVIWVGAIRVDKQWDWLFAMNEFEAGQPGAKSPLQ